MGIQYKLWVDLPSAMAMEPENGIPAGMMMPSKVAFVRHFVGIVEQHVVEPKDQLWLTIV